MERLPCCVYVREKTSFRKADLMLGMKWLLVETLRASRLLLDLVSKTSNIDQLSISADSLKPKIARHENVSLMARTHAITNGNHASGDALPPSTLAAQIVQNQVRPTVTKQSEQQALFNNLLSELLHSSSADVETNVETNVQLIKVLVEAGLSVLIHEQPFAPDILVQQAKDSIAVIEHTFNRQPEILAAPVHEAGPPVCAWLLARVAAIAGRRAADKIPLFHLLDIAARALSRPTKLWRFAVAFKNLLQDTADGKASQALYPQ